MTPEQQEIRATEDPAGIYLYEEDGSVWKPTQFLRFAASYSDGTRRRGALQQLHVYRCGPRQPTGILKEWRDVPVVDVEEQP